MQNHFHGAEVYNLVLNKSLIKMIFEIIHSSKRFVKNYIAEGKMKH